MIFIHLLLIFIFPFIAIVLAIDSEINKELNSAFASFIFLILFIALSAFLVIGIIKCENADWVTDKEPYAVESIVSLGDNNLANGKIYLRRGYIEEDLYYQYIVKLNNGGFKANKVKSANATLFYDTENYRVEWYKQTKSWLYWKQERICHKIYVPNESITNDYLIDLN